MRALAVLACLLPTLSLAVDIRGFVQVNEVCQSTQEVQDATVELDGGLRTAMIRRTGDFVIRDVDPGLYTISVNSQQFTFDHFLVDVTEDKYPLVHPYMPGTPLLPKPNTTYGYPMALIARKRNNYFVPRESFNVLGMFKNPMMLMMVGTAVMMFAMPWLMANMDPEAVEDAKKMQAKLFGAQQAIQNGDLSSAFKQVSADENAPAAQGSSQQHQLKQRAQKKKR
ncbi:hypothetical protein BKA62DRAFT_687108 [Auriculariales sp. MPI-PUGE-AT-0066]|nr:hypothetical protein BKA62DRAFT_687108 [Auriculariales sp. MPI-PUGE-AT-0066]